MDIVIAFILDFTIGDPPNRFHPVAWMGHYIRAWETKARGGSLSLLLNGAGMLFSGVTLSVLAGWWIERITARLPRGLRVSLRAALLKTSFSLRGLIHAAGEVQRALEHHRLEEARRLVRWHLVSRDTSALTASQVAAATIESLAENASDGVIAPLLYYLIGGLPAALAYRFVNTADAMVGYRDGAHEWQGKVPAHVDDVLNFVPARLTALGIVVAAHLLGEDARHAWHIWRRDAARTASPNAGHPMSAMAGALHVRLEKVGSYVLGPGEAPPESKDIARAARMASVAALFTVAMLCAIWRGVRKARLT